MKTVAILAACLLSSCVTITETRPDGTVIKTRVIDQNALAVGSALAQTFVDRNSGK